MIKALRWDRGEFAITVGKGDQTDRQTVSGWVDQAKLWGIHRAVGSTAAGTDISSTATSSPVTRLPCAVPKAGRCIPRDHPRRSAAPSSRFCATSPADRRG